MYTSHGKSTSIVSNVFRSARLIVALMLCFTSWERRRQAVVEAQVLMTCNEPEDGVVDLIILYDFRMFSETAQAYSVKYDPVPEYAFRPVKVWLKKYSGVVIDPNRATLTVCIHGMSTNNDGLECRSLSKLSDFDRYENVDVLNRYLGAADYARLRGQGHSRSTVIHGVGAWLQNPAFDPRKTVPNVIFAHISDPTPTRDALENQARGALDKNTFVVYVMFVSHGVTAATDSMYTFVQDMIRRSLSQNFSVVSANEPYNFDAFVRICTIYSNCRESEYASSECYSPVTVTGMRTCVKEMTVTHPTCPKSVTTACVDPNSCAIECNKVQWIEWACPDTCSGRPMAVRTRGHQRSNRYSNEYCTFRETKDCPPEMITGGGTCAETTTSVETSGVTTAAPSIWTSDDLTMIIIIGGVTLLVLICLVGFVCLVKNKKREDEKEEVEYASILKTLEQVQQPAVEKAVQPPGQSMQGTGQSGYNAGTGQSGYVGGAPGYSKAGGYSQAGGTGQIGNGRGGTGYSAYGPSQAGTGESGHGGAGYGRGGTGYTAYGGATGQTGYGGTGQTGYGGTGQTGYGGTGQTGYGGTGQTGYGATGQTGYGGTSQTGYGGTGQTGYGGTGQTGYGGTKNGHLKRQ